MCKITLLNANEIQIATEICGMVRNCDASVSGNVLTIDPLDGDDFAAVAQDAEKYWRGRGKKAMAKAAERVMRACREMAANERYLSTFEK